MIDTESFYKSLINSQVKLFTGVPDSLLKDLCFYIDDHAPKGMHIITANEGNAVSLAIGYYLSTKRLSLVYMQNSGLGNAINPLVSLADSKVYSIPMLLIIGWRGEPGFNDEPQHIKQGEITLKQLEVLDIPYKILDASSGLEIVDEMCNLAKTHNQPVALVVRKNSFSPYQSESKRDNSFTLKRELALNTLLDLTKDDILVSTTGKTSRELYELRKRRGESTSDFLTVGGMGHTSSIAAGVALGAKTKRILCIDGDGSMLMHMGSLAINSKLELRNFIYIILNNKAHESVGGQETAAGWLDLEALSRSLGYKNYFRASSENEIKEVWSRGEHKNGPIFIEIQICKGSRIDLGRPDKTPLENKIKFMEKIYDGE